MVVVHIQRDNGPDMQTFTRAGGLETPVPSSAGISINANYFVSERDRQTCVPLTLLAQSASTMRTIYATPKSAPTTR